jgi:hypothetical protein
VRAEAAELLDRPPLAVAQEVGGDAEKLLDRGGAAGVIGVVDLGAQELRRLGRRVRNGRGEIDEPDARQGIPS